MKIHCAPFQRCGLDQNNPRKHRLESGSNRIEIVVDHEPVLAGIDPRNLLIDRRPDDNTKDVVME